MDKRELVSYLERLDAALAAPPELYIYGSAVVILLDAPGRTSLDIAVAGDAALPAGDTEALDDAARLHLALPSGGYASQRALERLALYQTRSRAYGMPLFIRAVRSRLDRPAVEDAEVPGRLVRDVALPELARSRHNGLPARSLCRE